MARNQFCESRDLMPNERSVARLSGGYRTDHRPALRLPCELLIWLVP